MAKNSKVHIQAVSGAQDDVGEPLKDWVNIANGTVWADIRDVGGREMLAAGAEHSEVTTRIRIWRRDEVTAAMRILHGAVVYEIVAPLLEGLDTTLLLCKRLNQ